MSNERDTNQEDVLRAAEVVALARSLLRGSGPGSRDETTARKLLTERYVARRALRGGLTALLGFHRSGSKPRLSATAPTPSFGNRTCRTRFPSTMTPLA